MQFILSHWPLLFTCMAMIVAAVIDGWKLKVPNWLTFPLVLAGWALGGCHSFGLFEGTGAGGFGASLACTALGFVLLFPVYSIGGMGAGDVKMQMGFGAWIGAFYGVSGTDTHPGGMWIVFEEAAPRGLTAYADIQADGSFRVHPWGDIEHYGIGSGTYRVYIVGHATGGLESRVDARYQATPPRISASATRSVTESKKAPRTEVAPDAFATGPSRRSWRPVRINRPTAR